MTAHDWALDRWRTLLDQAWAATPGPWEHGDLDQFMGCGQICTMHPDLVGGNITAPSGDLYPRSGYNPHADMAFIAALSPDRVIVLCEQAIERLTAHAPFYDFGKWCRPCDLAQPCPEVRAWTTWWAGEDDYPEELK